MPGVRRADLDDVARRLGDVLEMQPPQGLVEKVRGLKKLKSIADSRPKTVRSGAVPGGRPRGRRRRPRPAADPALLAGRPGAVHHAPGRDHARPAHRHAQRRHVPHAEGRRAHDVHALADPQGRPRRLPRRGRPARGRRRARARPGDAPTPRSAPLPKHIDEFMLAGFLKGEPVELVKGEDGRPRGAGERRDRARGLRRAGRPRRSRARSATTPATTRPPSRSRSST